MKPFVKSNKNDFLDAEAIAEAVEARHALCRELSRDANLRRKERRRWIIQMCADRPDNISYADLLIS